MRLRHVSRASVVLPRNVGCALRATSQLCTSFQHVPTNMPFDARATNPVTHLISVFECYGPMSGPNRERILASLSSGRPAPSGVAKEPPAGRLARTRMHGACPSAAHGCGRHKFVHGDVRITNQTSGCQPTARSCAVCRMSVLACGGGVRKERGCKRGAAEGEARFGAIPEILTPINSSSLERPSAFSTDTPTTPNTKWTTCSSRRST